MTILEKIRDSVIDHATQWASAGIVTLLMSLLALLGPVILEAIGVAISPRMLTILLAGSVIFNLLLVVTVVVLARHPLRLRFGMLWDKKNNPHCGVCKNPLSNYVRDAYHNYSYRCGCCNKDINLRDELGNPLTIQQVRQALD